MKGQLLGGSLDHQSAREAGEGSALAVRGVPSFLNTNNNNSRQRRGRPWCDHCKRPGHLKETCWKIHGKPTERKQRPGYEREGRANSATTADDASAETNPFTKEQLKVLQELFSKTQNSTTGTSMLTQKGNFITACTVNKEKVRPWIVDSGA